MLRRSVRLQAKREPKTEKEDESPLPPDVKVKVKKEEPKDRKIVVADRRVNALAPKSSDELQVKKAKKEEPKGRKIVVADKRVNALALKSSDELQVKKAKKEEPKGRKIVVAGRRVNALALESSDELQMNKKEVEGRGKIAEALENYNKTTQEMHEENERESKEIPFSKKYMCDEIQKTRNATMLLISKLPYLDNADRSRLGRALEVAPVVDDED